jgi:hypothetical protein
VVASLQCDFAAAGKATKGKSIDISKAVIKADVTFAYVNKNSAGVSLQIPAIPVFTGITVAPNLEASKTGESSQSDTWSFKVDPDALTSCPGTKAENNWLVTKLLTTFPKKTDIELSSLKTEVSFIVTKVGSAGFKLNIVPIAIGPQLGANQSNTQKVLINFDWAEKQKSAPSSKQPVSAAPASAVSPSKQ